MIAWLLKVDLLLVHKQQSLPLTLSVVKIFSLYSVRPSLPTSNNRNGACLLLEILSYD